MLALSTQQCTAGIEYALVAQNQRPKPVLKERFFHARCTMPVLHNINANSCLSCRGWRQACQQDLEDRPRWSLSCYGRDHRPNEIMGDTSPEEVRWADLRELRSGQAGRQQLESRWQAARALKEKQFKVLAHIAFSMLAACSC